MFDPLRCVVPFAFAFSCATSSAACVAPRVLHERFISADCELCWEAAPPLPAPQAATPVFVLDWIVPSVRGDDAPLAPAALSEARARVERAGALRSDEALTQSHPLPARSALLLTVADGPASNGYIGLQFTLKYASTRALPQGLAGYVALIEQVAAGDDGTPVARQLVRSVIGPLPLDGLAAGKSIDHLRAARYPESAKPERLSVVGWVETPAGRVLAVAGRRDPTCGR